MLYESYIHPITILSALPSAGVGALLALILWPRPGHTPSGQFGVEQLLDLRRSRRITSSPSSRSSASSS